MTNAIKNQPLPTTPEGVTAEWLSSVLPQKVASIEVTKTVLDATTSKLFITLTWADPEAARAADLPKHVCVKGGFNPAIMNAMAGGLLTVYTHEAMWFKTMAPKLKAPVEVPKCWWSGADSSNAICIFDDLAIKGYEFGEGATDYSVEWVKELLEQLAGVHVAGWGAKAEDYPWLDPNAYHKVMNGFFQMWDTLILGPDRPPMPEKFKDKDRVVAMLNKSYRLQSPKTQTFIHGDPHAGNTYMTSEGKPRLLDWQVVGVNSAFIDVGYCIVSAMSIADRRVHEMELLDYYLDCLVKLGGPRFTRDEVMTEYCRGFLIGWGWIFTPSVFQSKERVFTMAARYHAAIDDHNVMEMVEAIEE